MLCAGCSTTNVYNSHPAVISDYNVAGAYRSVALLTIESPSGYTVSATGFAYDKDRIITAGHFCISALEIQIFESHSNDVQMTHYNDKFELVTQKKVEIDDLSKTQDLCVLKKKNHGLRPLPVTQNYNKLKIRDKVTIVGFPSGVAMGEFDGRVMSLFYKGLGPDSIKGKLVVSSASTGGISGSPIILEETGEVVGVLVMGHIMFDHLSFGITGKDLRIFVNGLK